MALYAQVGTAWCSLVGAGVMARLQDFTSDERHVMVNAARLGLPAVADIMLPSRKWARGWNADDVQRAVELVNAKATDVLHTLHDLRGSYDPSRPSWRAAVVQALEAREEIECVWALLRDLHNAPMPQGLQLLDEAGHKFADLLVPMEEAQACETLRRASIFDIDAWWTECAAP